MTGQPERTSSADATAFLSSVLPPAGVGDASQQAGGANAADRRGTGAPDAAAAAAAAAAPGLARQSSGDIGDGEADISGAAEQQSKPRRKRKRKRKRRSSAKSAPAEEEVSESGASVAGAAAGAAEAGAAQLEHQSSKRRRTRNRATPRRKPWSQMTWEEKQAVEEREAQMAAQRERERPELPMDPNGHVPRGVNPRDYRPAAPRNTTQELLKDARGRQRVGNETPSSGGSDVDGRGPDSDGDMGDDELEDLGSGSMAAAFNARLAGHPTPAHSPEDSALAATVKRQKQTIDRLEDEVAALRAQLQAVANASAAAASLPSSVGGAGGGGSGGGDHGHAAGGPAAAVSMIRVGSTPVAPNAAALDSQRRPREPPRG
eukprot:COSAG06_NODE_1638_length_8838_cov_4.151619_6_plen_375_part_00